MTGAMTHSLCKEDKAVRKEVGRQRKGHIRERTSLELTKFQRAVENGEEWSKVVVKRGAPTTFTVKG